jgi:glycine oxidase
VATPDQRASDAIIVGAGVIGLSCAWRLARMGADVRVVERDNPGAGATGVAAGMLAPVGELSFGERGLLELNLAAARAYPEFIAELEDEAGVEAGYDRRGALHVALDRDEKEALRRRHEHQLSLGLDAEWLRPSECRDREPGLAPGVAGGVMAPDEGAVDPRALTNALAEAARRAGAVIETGIEVAGALGDAESIAGVRTGDGRELPAKHVVVATGCWSGSASWLPQAARPPVRPVKGQIVTLRGGGGTAVCERIVATERVYVVPRGDGRLVVGATVEERGFDTTVTAGGVHDLLREGYRALPEIAELELLEARAGLRPGTPDNLPLIGAGVLDGLILATGHFRNGVLLAPITAEAVAAFVGDEDPPPETIHADPARVGARRAAEVGAR